MAYIPEIHKNYNLLPFRAIHGGEVFAYASTTKLEAFLRDFLPLKGVLDPYGYESYTAYAEMLCSLRGRYEAWPEATAAIDSYSEQLLDLNKKESWSVCRYIGKDFGGVCGLTCGQTYYWPCSASHPAFIGVIDDEEFTNYWYSPNPKFWLIAEDPTGMAAKTMLYYQETKREKRMALITDR